MELRRVLAVIMALLCILHLVQLETGNRWDNRRWLVRPINQRRQIYGESQHLNVELRDDPEMFHRRFRMRVEQKDRLLAMLRPRLLKKGPRALTPEQRLNICLRYLTTGDEISSIAMSERIGESTARKIIKEVCDAIIEIMQPIYLRKPNREEWLQITADFLELWNMPNCAGAIDGKHFTIEAPDNSGSEFFNFKKHFSISMLAACDARYIFTLVHCGEMGSNSDAAIFSESPIGRLLEQNRLGFPQGEATLPGSSIRTPCFLVGDDAFPLRKNLMKPFPGQNLTMVQRIFNYRLSRARRIIENAFGILTARFRVFKKVIAFQPKTVDKLILASVILHNFLRIEEEMLNPIDRVYCPPEFTQQWRNQRRQPSDIVQMNSIQAFRDSLDIPESAMEMRNQLANYFVSPQGQVPWQMGRVQIHQDLHD